MPAYFVDFETQDGPQRGRFTIDHERALDPQIRQILEELNHQQVILAGGPEDELRVFWNGRETSTTETPTDLGLGPERPLELRMRPRRRAVAPVAPPMRPPQPAPPLRGPYAGAVWGVTGALAAWAALAFAADLGTWVDSYLRLDIAAAAALGSGIGGLVLAGAALRRGEATFRATALGVLMGGVAAAVGGAAGALLGSLLFPDPGPLVFLVRRALGWLVLGAALGCALGATGGRWDRLRPLEGALAGGIAGVSAALIFSLPGPSDLWQAIAFAALGAGVGWGTSGPSLARARGVLELQPVAQARLPLWRIREWGIWDGGSVALRGATVRCEHGRFRIEPRGAEPLHVSGQRVTDASPLHDGDRAETKAGTFRFRRQLVSLLLALCASAPISAQSGDLAHPRLVRCAPGHPAPCLQSQILLEPGAESMPPPTWEGRIGPNALHDPEVVPSAPAQPLSLLVLVDVSGSMAGGGMHTVRSALRGFLRAIPRGHAQVALAPFSSHEVVRRVREARFVAPSEAAKQVDELPAPQGNTGLYAAVTAGLDVLKRTPGPRALLVITDGRNDVRPGDDRDLLSGAAGRATAQSRVAESGLPVFMIGFGPGVDTVELRTLAPVEGRHLTVPEDPVALAQAFARAGRHLQTTRSITWTVPTATRSALARGALPYRVWTSADGEPHSARWIPPLFALPAFTGVAELPAGRVAPEARRPFARGAVLIGALTTLLALIWVVVPNRLWPATQPLPKGEGRIRTLPLRPREALPGAEAGPLRTDLQEAPPRRPSDTTANAARRVASGKGPSS